jgi:uncharacterized C2H2 Zn-finger protein
LANIIYQCAACSKLFSLKSSLRRHIFTEHKHAEVADEASTHSCPACSMVFKTKDNLRQHNVRFHGTTQQAQKRQLRDPHSIRQCPICSQKCYGRQTLHRHILRKHPDVDARAFCPLLSSSRSLKYVISCPGNLCLCC